MHDWQLELSEILLSRTYGDGIPISAQVKQSKAKKFEAHFLSFSAGTGSSALLWMVLRGEIPKPEHFYVLNADPGMEDYRSYEYVDMMEAECQKAGIEFIRAKGRNLFLDLTDKSTWVGKTRLDTPPFWTINRDTGKKGRMRQKCTAAYKIAPMDREVRLILERDFGINRKNTRLPDACVIRWIGFTHDEWHRCSETGRRFSRFKYPLIENKIDRESLRAWYEKCNIPMPPRSVCVGCYANDTAYFKAMHEERPGDFEKACLVDDSIRDLSQFGVRDICFVSSTCIPLRELAKRGFLAKDEDNIAGCYSGYCFV